jgi:hypothetical protein
VKRGTIAQRSRSASRPGGFDVSLNARTVLRAIRGMVDPAGVYGGTDAAAAAASGLPVDVTRRALHELSGRNMIVLRRAGRAADAS